MKKLFAIIAALLLSSCVVKKEVSIFVYDSDEAEVDVLLKGSDLEDLKPELALPLSP